MRSVGGGIIRVLLVTSFVSANVIKLVVSKGSAGGTLVVLSRRETYMASLGQEDMIFDGKEPVELWGGGSGSAIIMQFLTM